MEKSTFTTSLNELKESLKDEGDSPELMLQYHAINGNLPLSEASKSYFERTL